MSNNLKITTVLYPPFYYLISTIWFPLFDFHYLISPILFYRDDGYNDGEDNLAHGSGSIVAKKPKGDV